ncbi:hypothetical protein VOLCADRAFT_87912 [Volvox carteri f. nagariensis]|uniref:Uncharacterized protein n=1 Tax=Volvox carteri f. nagariensis TaxID=3068 RepID=D8TMK3_VOLCA|nr:uncharacterized protein VOLCADRAFT_87912 [Volvox carteri f. nagariensis]EFJ51138.1 hypothetical protein VOLCADRAFT_87912 [Volvox carteri f. nagariensis]|eukprot:XP_002947605.1 hypothetical protein VOLCADRAFT_87912 [Volvox carteri f. nagariensis]
MAAAPDRKANRLKAGKLRLCLLSVEHPAWTVDLAAKPLLCAGNGTSDSYVYTQARGCRWQDQHCCNKHSSHHVDTTLATGLYGCRGPPPFFRLRGSRHPTCRTTVGHFEYTVIDSAWLMPLRLSMPLWIIFFGGVLPNSCAGLYLIRQRLVPLLLPRERPLLGCLVCPARVTLTLL